jgi:nicotinamide mononucleotide transporter
VGAQAVGVWLGWGKRVSVRGVTNAIFAGDLYVDLGFEGTLALVSYFELIFFWMYGAFMPSWLELSANFFYLVSVLLAARNSVHTWPVGLIGCLLFGWLFLNVQLYADVTLQAFFIITSLLGWWGWLNGRAGQISISRTPKSEMMLSILMALIVAFAYGALLYHFTNAYAPFWDSLVMAFSVLAQLLLMRRKVENWYFWLIVNSIAVPLFYSRELYLTAFIYTLFWLNAWYGLYRWRYLYLALNNAVDAKGKLDNA